jgi:hypothetical protein
MYQMLRVACQEGNGSMTEIYLSMMLRKITAVAGSSFR